MMKRFCSAVLIMLCLLLCACSASPDVAQTSLPTEAEPLTEAVRVPLTKEELIERAVTASDLQIGSLDDAVGTVYSFDGVTEAIETDRALVNIELKDGTVAAAVYLSAEELSSVVLKQKVSFVGRVDEVKNDDGEGAAMVLCNAAITADRFKYYGKFVERNPEYESNTWTMRFTSTDVREVTFVNPMDSCAGESFYYTYKDIDGKYVDAYLLNSEDELVDYDPVLLDWPDIVAMAPPKLNMSEVQAMIAQELTLDEVAEKIDTLADAIQYLHQKGFVFDGGDLQFWYGSCRWSVNRSAQTVFKDNVGNCGGGSNLLNYLLQGDFEEQGYVQYKWNANGHITNYFKQDGMYFFFDLTMLTVYDYKNVNRYEIFVTDDPKKFGDDYVGRNHRLYKADSPDHLLLLSMYAWEGNHLPTGYGNVKNGWPRSYYFPKQYEDQMQILFAEGVGIPNFVKGPGPSSWPEEAR